MSYLTYAKLTEDVDYGRRSRSCIAQQANYFLNDARPQYVAMSKALLKGTNMPILSNMLDGMCAGADFDNVVDNGDGTIDSTKITDLQMLAQCQKIYPEVAALWFDETGAPIPPT